MSEITSPGASPRQSIAPGAPSAEGAPTITAPGAPATPSPTSGSSRAREQAMREKFSETEQQFGRSRYLSSARKSETKAKPAPKTPLSDEYVTIMRPKDGRQQRREMLDLPVIREEQRKREGWLRAEEVRAAVLPHQLRAEVQYAAQVEYINAVSQEHAKAVQERQARDAEAARYGYSSHEALQAAIQEEKAIRRANEIGAALTDAQLIAQTVAREGYRGAAVHYGQDPQVMIAELAATARAAQSSLEQNFGNEIGTKPQEYFHKTIGFTVEAQKREVAAAKLHTIIDPINVAIKAGRPAADLPLLPGGIMAMARASGADSSFDAWAYHYTETVAKAKVERESPAPPPNMVTDARGERTIDQILKTLPVGGRFGASLLGTGIGTLVDSLSYPARVIAPGIPLAREQFARHPGDMVKGALIGAGIITGVAGGGLLLGGGGGAVAAGTGASGTIHIGGGATGLATRTAAPVVIEEGFKAAAAIGAIALGSQIIQRTINFPSGLPDWAERYHDPHGGIGSEGGEISPPDWMSGDPEVIIDPGVDWRAPGESFGDYLQYRRKLPGEGPPGTGPLPYYPGPELSRPGPTTRFIDSPELTPNFDYFNASELPMGRTIHMPEIEPDAIRKRFAPELPTPSSGELFPTELPGKVEQDLDQFLPFGRVPVHPLGDPVSPVWHPPDYLESLMTVSAGVTLPGTMRRGIGYRRPAVPTLPFDGIHESLRVYPERAKRARRKTLETDEIQEMFRFIPVPPAIPQVVAPPGIWIRSRSLMETSFTPIQAVGVEVKASLGEFAVTNVKPTGVALPEAVSLALPSAAVNVSSLAAPVTETVAGVTAATATRAATSPSLQTAHPNIPAIRYQHETPTVRPTVNITIPGFSLERRRRDNRRRRRDKGDEWWIDYADLPTPHARLEEAYTDLRDPKIRPAKMIRNIERVTVGIPPKTAPRPKVVRVGPKVRKLPHRVPWDIPAVRPLDVVGIPDFHFGPAPKRKKSRRRR